MVLNTATVEKKMTQRIAAAGIRLRFDKVALRLLDGVKAALAQSLPEDQSVAFTVTAPIKLPAKTSAALQEWLRRLPTQGLATTINGNEIGARIINNSTSGMPRVIGFVHNAECNADLALDIAEASLRGR
jgi:hypothetical protein